MKQTFLVISYSVFYASMFQIATTMYYILIEFRFIDKNLISKHFTILASCL